MVRGSRIRGQKFRREHPIGPYTVDFVCLALKLIVEVDGKDHLTEEGRQRDRQRDRFLEQQGFEILRINGYQVTQDARAVRQQIEDALENRIRNRSQEP
jgi:very-short-patch-repair endonuclease